MRACGIILLICEHLFGEQTGTGDLDYNDWIEQKCASGATTHTHTHKTSQPPSHQAGESISHPGQLPRNQSLSECHVIC
jgi:hypothetical protein